MCTFSASVGSSSEFPETAAKRTAATETGLRCPYLDPAQYAPSPMINPISSSRKARRLFFPCFIAASFYKLRLSEITCLDHGPSRSVPVRPLCQLVERLPNLSFRSCKRAGAIDHDISVAPLFIHGQLRGNPPLNLFKR